MRKKGQNSFCDCVDEYNFNEYVSNSMSAHTAHDSVMDPLNRMHSLMKSNHTWKKRAREITTTTSPNEWKFVRRRQGFSRVHFFVLFWHLFAIPFYVHYIYVYIAIERRMREREWKAEENKKQTCKYIEYDMGYYFCCITNNNICTVCIYGVFIALR